MKEKYGNLKPNNVFVRRSGGPPQVIISDILGAGLKGTQENTGRVTYNDPSFFT